MRVKTTVRAGDGANLNHSEAQVRGGLKVQTGVKAGKGPLCPTVLCGDNHSEARARAAGLKVHTGVKAGVFGTGPRQTKPLDVLGGAEALLAR